MGSAATEPALVAALVVLALVLAVALVRTLFFSRPADAAPAAPSRRRDRRQRLLVDPSSSVRPTGSEALSPTKVPRREVRRLRREARRQGEALVETAEAPAALPAEGLAPDGLVTEEPTVAGLVAPAGPGDAAHGPGALLSAGTVATADGEVWPPDTGAGAEDLGGFAPAVGMVDATVDVLDSPAVAPLADHGPDPAPELVPSAVPVGGPVDGTVGTEEAWHRAVAFLNGEDPGQDAPAAGVGAGTPEVGVLPIAAPAPEYAPAESLPVQVHRVRAEVALFADGPSLPGLLPRLDRLREQLGRTTRTVPSPRPVPSAVSLFSGPVDVDALLDDPEALFAPAPAPAGRGGAPTPGVPGTGSGDAAVGGHDSGSDSGYDSGYGSGYDSGSDSGSDSGYDAGAGGSDLEEDGPASREAWAAAVAALEGADHLVPDDVQPDDVQPDDVQPAGVPLPVELPVGTPGVLSGDALPGDALSDDEGRASGRSRRARRREERATRRRSRAEARASRRRRGRDEGQLAAPVAGPAGPDTAPAGDLPAPAVELADPGTVVPSVVPAGPSDLQPLDVLGPVAAEPGGPVHPAAPPVELADPTVERLDDSPMPTGPETPVLEREREPIAEPQLLDLAPAPEPALRELEPLPAPAVEAVPQDTQPAPTRVVAGSDREARRQARARARAARAGERQRERVTREKAPDQPRLTRAERRQRRMEEKAHQAEVKRLERDAKRQQREEAAYRERARKLGFEVDEAPAVLPVLPTRAEPVPLHVPASELVDHQAMGLPEELPEPDDVQL